MPPMIEAAAAASTPTLNAAHFRKTTTATTVVRTASPVDRIGNDTNGANGASGGHIGGSGSAVLGSGPGPGPGPGVAIVGDELEGAAAGAGPGPGPGPGAVRVKTSAAIRSVETKAGPNAALCRFFNTTKGCQFGAHCRYRHVIVNTERNHAASDDGIRTSAGTGTGTGTSTGTSATSPVRLGGSWGVGTEPEPVSVSAPSPTSASASASISTSASLGSGSGSTAILCRYFAAGYCGRGDSCWYKHDVSALNANSSTATASSSQLSSSSTSTPTTPPASIQIASYSSKSAATSPPSPITKSHNARPTPVVRPPAPEPCVICFEEEPAIYGLLEQCSHAFCLDCIRSWRNPNTKESPVILSGVIKTCPACRAPSRYITPSRLYYPESHPMKVITIKNYKVKLANIPCKYFAKNPSNPFCPFGFDCFYAHKNPDGTPFVFEHGIEEMAERAADRERRRAQRTRASDLRRVRETLDSVGRMLHDDFEGFVAAMRAEFGDTVGDQFDLDIDDDDDDWAGEDDDDGDSWTTDDEDGLTELADDEEHDISERWFTERALAWHRDPATSDSRGPGSPRRSTSSPPPAQDLPGFRRPHVGMNSEEPVLSYGSPSDDDDDDLWEPSSSLRTPSSSNRIVFGNFGEVDDTDPSSSSPSDVQAPILFGSFRPEDIPWQADPPRTLGSNSGSNRSGWWI